MATELPPGPEKVSNAHLTQYDIHLARDPDRPTKVVASVMCERRGCEMLVEACARCPHFARIETHEAGYLLRCREREDTSEPGVCEHPPEPSVPSPSAPDGARSNED
jgi:hypothetical protein